jgi:hypothetical protein
MDELPEIQIGEILTNLEPRWIRVKNPEGNANDSKTLHAFNERAWIREGSKLTVIAIDGDQILVSYQKPGQEKSWGTEAGNGTLFLVSRWKLMKMTTSHLRATSRDFERTYIIELLKRVNFVPS